MRNHTEALSKSGDRAPGAAAVPACRDGASRWAARGMLLAAMALVAALVLPGINWGLPSPERNAITFGPDRKDWHPPEIPSGEVESPWEAYPNFVSGGAARQGAAARSAFNPIRSYHPDEYVFFKSLSGMRPAQLKLFHGFFGWPALQFYVAGAALKAASLIGLVHLTPDMAHYFRAPEDLAAMYRVGRIVTLLFALGAVWATARAGARLFGRAAGSAAALLLAAMPLFTVNARWMTADVPMLFWIALVLHCSAHILNDEAPGWRWYAWGGACLGLAAATRYQGALAALLILTAHLLRRSGGGTWRARLADRRLWTAAAVSVGVFLITNPYIVVRSGQFASEFLGELRGSRSPGGLATSLALTAACGVGIVLSMVAAAAGAMAVARKSREAWFVIVAFGVPGVLLALGRPVMARYYLPALLLIPLLTGWAFGELHRKGLEKKRRAARLAAPMLLLIVLAATFLQSLAFARLFTDPAADTRTRAGEWIAAALPEGATIGVISEPWQFDLPPLNPARHRIVVIPLDAPWPEGPKPQYFLSSDVQFPPVAVRGALTAGEQARYEEVFLGKGAYIAGRRFEAWPGMRSLLRYGPHDLRYANPVIVVSARR